MIDKKSPIPIYYQLEMQIRQMIESKQLRPGDALPSEREFTEKYNISRMTVRQAINNLVNDGLLYRQKGKGTFVADKKLEQDLSDLTSFSEDIKEMGMTPHSQLVSLQKLISNSRIAANLRINVNDPIYEIKRVRMADDEPIALETMYCPQKLVGDITEKDLANSFYEYVERKLQLKISYGEQTIEAALANEEEINLLRLNEGDPILLMKRVSYLDDGLETPIEYVKSAYRADKYKIHLQMKRK